MEKRERIEKTIAGEPVDRIPVALWRHFPGDDQRAADLAHSILTFQQRYDWDFVVMMPASSYSVIDYGITDEWAGDIDGTRRISRRIITRSLHWTELRTLDAYRGTFGKQVECLRMLAETLAPEGVPFVQVVHSPLLQAMKLAGLELTLRNMRTHPDRLRTGLNILTESTLRLIEATRRIGTAGIYYTIAGADYTLMAEAEYAEFGMPYDQKILGSIPDHWWLNAVQVRGQAPMLRLFHDYPVQVLHWDDQQGHPDLDRGKQLFPGAVCGGLDREAHIQFGTPAVIRDAIRQAVQATDGRRFILSAGDSIYLTSPWSNIQAVREVAETAFI